MHFNFHLPVKIEYGDTALEKIAVLYQGCSLFIIASNSVYKTGILDNIPTLFSAKNSMFYLNITPNPDISELNATYKIAKGFDASVVLAIGGGSVLDASKCIAAMLTNNGDLTMCQGGNLANPPIPLICAPTTSGTGSEVTNVSVISDEYGKKPYVSDILWPKHACIIPKLSYSMPKAVAAETGWDAFCHALEAHWSKSANPISDALATYSMRLILHNIVASVNNNCKIARRQMSLASLLAGMAFSQTRTTAPHAISFSLTSDFGLSHGRACAITLYGFLQYCDGYWQEKQTQLLSFLGFDNLKHFADLLLAKLKDTDMPISLSQIGIKESDIALLAKKGIEHAIAHQLPRAITQEDMQQILFELL